MSIGIIYNFAEHPGGGDLVMLTILEALVEKSYSVTLYTSYPRGLAKAIETFDKDKSLVEEIEVKHIETPPIRHPYNIYLIAKKIARRNLTKEHDLFIVSDDVPKPIANTRVFVYVNYPHAARILLKQLIPYKYKKTVLRTIAWRIHSTLFPHYFLTNWHRENIYVAVNSTLTEHHVKEALKPINMTKIYPPVQVRLIERKVCKKDKEDLIISIGRFEPEREYEVLLKALKRIDKSQSPNTIILGFEKDRRYLRYLLRLISHYDLKDRVEIMSSVNRGKIYELLSRASIIVNTHPLEQFGISVVEGMACGCLPIVRKGLNGPWIDIVYRGEYGYGYRNSGELSSLLLNRHVLLQRCSIQKIISRAQEFDESNFVSKLLKVLATLI